MNPIIKSKKDPCRALEVKSFCSLLFIYLLPASLLFPQNGDITFHFDPPDGTTFIETVRQSRKIIYENTTQSDERIIENSSRYTIRKKDFGYAVLNTPLQSSQPLSAKLASLERSIISNLDITYELDQNGRLIQITNLDEALETFKDSLPMEEMWTLIENFLGKQSVEQIYINHWNNRGMFGDYIGRTLTLNHKYGGPTSIPLGTGDSVSALLSVELKGLENYSGHTCVRMEFQYESDDAKVGEMLTGLIDTMMDRVLTAFLPPDQSDEVTNQIPDMRFTNPKIIYSNNRLIDPETGLLCSETEIRRICATLELPGEEGSNFEIVDLTEYSYDYD